MPTRPFIQQDLQEGPWKFAIFAELKTEISYTVNQKIVDSVFPKAWSKPLKTGAGIPIDVSFLPLELEDVIWEEEEAKFNAEM